MPYVNWKEREIGQRIEPQIDARSTITLSLTEERRLELISVLQELFLGAEGGPGSTELRIDLPKNWIVFWKSREMESRLLLAHPQKGEWVATIALEVEHGKRVLERLKVLNSGDAFSLSEQGMIGSISNVEVILEMREQVHEKLS